MLPTSHLRCSHSHVHCHTTLAHPSRKGKGILRLQIQDPEGRNRRRAPSCSLSFHWRILVLQSCARPCPKVQCGSLQRRLLAAIVFFASLLDQESRIKAEELCQFRENSSGLTCTVWFGASDLRSLRMTGVFKGRRFESHYVTSPPFIRVRAQHTNMQSCLQNLRPSGFLSPSDAPCARLSFTGNIHRWFAWDLCDACILITTSSFRLETMPDCVFPCKRTVSEGIGYSVATTQAFRRFASCVAGG